MMMQSCFDRWKEYRASNEILMLFLKPLEGCVICVSIQKFDQRKSGDFTKNLTAISKLNCQLLSY